MACYHPLKAWVSPLGGITFRAVQGYSDKPLRLPCGYCRGCRKESIRQTAIRAIHEDQMSARSCYVTLTYRDSSLPADGSLSLKDWQNFTHRLRKRLGRFRYLMCGEYGGSTGRPHYHALLWGMDFLADRQYFKTTPQGHTLDTSALLDRIWKHGDLNPIGNVSWESCGYVAGYIMKKRSGPMAWAAYGSKIKLEPGQAGAVHAELQTILKPEFSCRSVRPGLGYNWIQKYMSDVYPSDELVVNGRINKPPAYYDRQFEIRDPKGFRKLIAIRAKEGELNKENSRGDRLYAKDLAEKLRTRDYARNQI